MWQTLSVLLLVGNAIQLYFMWKFDRDADAASAEAERIRETLLPTQEELIQAQDEIVQQDRQIVKMIASCESLSETLTDVTQERDEANQSAEHWKQRYELCDGIRQKLAESLAGRANGRQITLGLHDAKVVHGSVVVSLDSSIPAHWDGPDIRVPQMQDGKRCGCTIVFPNGNLSSLNDAYVETPCIQHQGHAERDIKHCADILLAKKYKLCKFAESSEL